MGSIERSRTTTMIKTKRRIRKAMDRIVGREIQKANIQQSIEEVWIRS